MQKDGYDLMNACVRMIVQGRDLTVLAYTAVLPYVQQCSAMYTFINTHTYYRKDSK